MTITHAHVSAIPNDPTKDVSSTKWNAAHVGELFKVVSVSLTAAQLLDLNVTPVDILSAQGGRKFIVPIAFVAHFRAGATPFDANMNLWVGWGATRALVVATAPLNAPLTINGLTVDRYTAGASTFNYEASAAAIENAPVRVANSIANPTVGNGTVTLSLYYDIIDGAP